ncbi:hypothetical protein [Pseudemcibacter aquimaris]|uniref:hypothetical protein n=1 Tax=Pseudemcibacter aquimaris TaxID=2857064 RepID=UPI002011D83C|nr:hypothetical protein [Pseudemcibacter aquimaris]MCC3862340.1 hypothetical protein [Pseudemcibacter aquimaris]WDU59229.1 hypothetical protein KW060_02965 [Pseudemcibacter aquimaris]
MIRLFDLDWYLENIRILGVIAILIGIGTWAMDFTGAVYVCPFCRAQRTVILLLGIFMTLPGASHFILKYVTSILGVYGLIVASNQHFRGWVRIQQGEFTWGEQWYLNSWMLSFFAICIITAQVWLLFLKKK